MTAQPVEWGVRYTPVSAEAIDQCGTGSFVIPHGTGAEHKQTALQIATFPRGEFIRDAVFRMRPDGEWQAVR